jgi:hypothetical protein
MAADDTAERARAALRMDGASPTGNGQCSEPVDGDTLTERGQSLELDGRSLKCLMSERK